ncbi:hypothetical protein HDU97_000303 [Phlyctochytrium planicorne]|nr:hypothetical protein HDU97_000303 [Phlyctochytrium planicorne]
MAAIPLTGVIADRIGRLPVILANIIGLLTLVVTILGIALGMPLYVLYVVAFLAGGLGVQGLFVAASAYISDTTTPESKSQNFAFLETVTIVGGLLAPFASGILSNKFGPATPISISVGITVVSLLWIVSFVPESLRVRKVPSPLNLEEIVEVSVETLGEGKSYGTTGSSSHDVGSTSSNGMRHSVSESTLSEDVAQEALLPPIPPPSKTSIYATVTSVFLDLLETLKLLYTGPARFLCFAIFALQFVGGGTSAYIFFYFFLRFGFTEASIGTMLVVIAMYKMFFLAIVLPSIKALYAWLKKDGKRSVKEMTNFELWLVMGGLLTYGVGYSSIDLIQEGWHIYILYFFESFAAIQFPTSKSLISQSFSEDDQGKIMAGLSFMENIAITVGGIIFSFLYQKSVENNLVGKTFYLCGVFAIIGMILVSLVDRAALAERIEEVQKSDAAKREREEAENDVVVFDDKRVESAV